ncbi:hypothetical protein TSUD_205470 [Trifolium subterraneum]|uniref:Uncharacterized protein n=1 Tax=Trifolium subterraneum TaxID=3900 RepID=A0A2Z6P6E1_TRISU|nr:hypothetical protein TSUD_205470 [Trifolium subterraneum]
MKSEDCKIKGRENIYDCGGLEVYCVLQSTPAVVKTRVGQANRLNCICNSSCCNFVHCAKTESQVT